MLTAGQVRNHSEVSVGGELERLEREDYGAYLRESQKRYTGESWYYIRSMARLLYIDNERATKMRIICSLPNPISNTELTKTTEEEIKDTIDWEKFTKWINRHDDLTEDNLVSRDIWVKYNNQQSKKGKIGRNALLDTIKNEVIDCNKVVLV